MVDEGLVLEGAEILLVDDQPANLDVLRLLLEEQGYVISLAPSGKVALKIASQMVPDLILLDVMMPAMDGYEVCRLLQQDDRTRDIPVIFVTAQERTEGALAGFQAGAVDYITKPYRDKEVLARVETHLRLSRLTRVLESKNRELETKNAELQGEITQRQKLKSELSMISEREAERWGLEGFVGQSATIQRIFKEIRLLQESAATSVMITGESGTGKELIARAIHFGSDRRENSFVPVNCAAMPANLAESMLFGHLRGSFTGADSDRVGYFEMAHEGTLFLDEVGDMPLDLQAKLLRVLEDGEIWRIGEQQGRTVDVRVVAATNANLQSQIQDGAFRQDLYYRLARFPVEAPPLRQRREDIPLLAQHFLGQFAREMGREESALSPEAADRLTWYNFPGNVRELKNIIERALIESGGEEIRGHHLHLSTEGPVEAVDGATAGDPLPADLPLSLELAELWVIKRAIARCNGNISEAARLLGTHRNRIYRAIAQDEHGSASDRTQVSHDES